MNSPNLELVSDRDRPSKRLGECRWFLMCHNSAVTTLTHPILGDVPICDRCVHLSMSRIDFGSYTGMYDMVTIMYRLMVDLNDGHQGDLHFENPADAADEWCVPIGDLLCIHGAWTDAGFGEGDPTLPDWKGLGIDPRQVGDTSGVYYTDDHLVIMGDNGMCACFWIFKKA